MATRKLGDDGEIIAYILDHREQHGYPPSVREIAAKWDVVPASAQSTLRRMYAEGLLVRTPGIPRSITISEAGMKLVHDPTLHG